MAQPEQAEPFEDLAMDMGTGIVLRIFRALRANGASLVEAAVITGAQSVMNAVVAADRQQREGEHG